MQTLVFNTDFGFALDGISTTHFKAGEKHTLPDSCADSAIQVGAAMRVDAPAPNLIAENIATSQPEVLLETTSLHAPEIQAVKTPKAKPAAKPKAKATT